MSGWVPLMCHLCGMKGFTEEAYNVHVIEKHIKSSHKCGVCSKEGMNDVELQEHIAQAHAFPDVQHQTPKAIECPICGQGFSDVDAVSYHIEFFHSAARTTAEAEYTYTCPICPETFSSAEAVGEHIDTRHDPQLELPVVSCPLCGRRNFPNAEALNAHVDTHFMDGSEHSAGSVPGPSTSSGSRGHQVAQQTQHREEQRDRHRAAAMEEKANCKEDWMEHARAKLEREHYAGKLTAAEYHESLAVMTRESHSTSENFAETQNLLAPIRNIVMSNVNTESVFFCSGELSGFTSTFFDRGWGCGYRNLQMIISQAMSDPCIKEKLPAMVPSISTIQSIIEAAWSKGIDRVGQQQLGKTLKRTRQWIGTSELWTFFTYQGVKTEIYEFTGPTGEKGTHPLLLELAYKHFSSGKSFISPLYLQHQGHSRTIIGCEKKKNGTLHLLILDPSMSKDYLSRIVRSESEGQILLRGMRKCVGDLTARHYQVLRVIGTLTAEEMNGSVSHTSMRIPEDIRSGADFVV